MRRLGDTCRPLRHTSAGVDLDQHGVTGGHLLADGARRQADAVFVRLDLLGNTDLHLRSPKFQRHLLSTMQCETATQMA